MPHLTYNIYLHAEITEKENEGATNEITEVISVKE
jgi:hypothetical protein